MIRSGVKENSNFSWWMPSQMSESGMNYYVPPACEFAESRLLSFLLFLSLNKREKVAEYLRPQSVVLKSFDQKKEIAAKSLQKMPSIRTGSGKREKIFRFGQDTYLVLDGLLAGTISHWNTNYHSNPFYPSRTKIEIKALRPLVETPVISEKIGIEIRHLLRGQPVDRHLVDLLNATNDLITQRGSYLQALFYLLDELDIEVNKTAITENNHQLQKTMKKIDSKTLSMLIINSGAY